VSATDRVLIHYRRLPDDEQIFDQRVVLERADVIVTVTEPLAFPQPLRALGKVILESGSRAVWFTFPGAWHDVGRFHLADGTFTGLYGNILTPPAIEARTWRTTDLFLDVWIPAGGEPALLDEDELEAALAVGTIDAGTAERARLEANQLLERAAAGTWPPPVTREWTLERIESDERRAAAGSGIRRPRPRSGASRYKS
jgi:predicted RNA-binding protein associated with RNAse of E/G family